MNNDRLCVFTSLAKRAEQASLLLFIRRSTYYLVIALSYTSSQFTGVTLK